MGFLRIDSKCNTNTKKVNLAYVSVYLTLSVVLFIGSTATMNTLVNAQTLPTCIDPTGKNLPCMIVISTLPAPTNAIRCQEPTGQILPCSYATQALSNGQQVVVITVYVQPNFVFTGGPISVVKEVIVHETKTKTRTVYEPCQAGQRLNPETFKCVDVPVCKPGQHLVFVGTFECVNVTPPGPPPGPPPGTTCDSKYYSGPCPPTDPNAYIKCISAALAADDNKNGLACARLLPDTPDNAYTKCISEALFNDDNIAALKCAKLLPPVSTANNLTNTTATPIPQYNITAATQPTNTSIPTSGGGKGTGTACVAGNCTSGTISTNIDCTKNPSDPSCHQHHTAAYLQALNSGSPNPYKPGTKDYEHYQAGLLARQQNSGAAGVVTPSGTNGNNNTPSPTKKCPDGSIIPVKDKCPTGSSSPSGSLLPPSGGSNSGVETGSNGGSGGSSSGGSSSGHSSSGGSSSGGGTEGSGSSSSGDSSSG